MMTRNEGKNRDQIEFTSLDELVPEDHLVRELENAIDWSFIYEMVADSYCEDNGRPSLAPVILIKLPVVQYMFGIRSMRQTIQEIKVNNAYRWFLDLGLHDPVPHFSTFGKNYMRRFKDSETNTSTAICVRPTRSSATTQRTGTATGNIRVIRRFVNIVRI